MGEKFIYKTMYTRKFVFVLLHCQTLKQTMPRYYNTHVCLLCVQSVRMCSKIVVNLFQSGYCLIKCLYYHASVLCLFDNEGKHILNNNKQILYQNHSLLLFHFIHISAFIQFFNLLSRTYHLLVTTANSHISQRLNHCMTLSLKITQILSW